MKKLAIVISFVFLFSTVLMAQAKPATPAASPATKPAPAAEAPASAPVKGNLKWKAVWCWSLVGKSSDDIKKLAGQAKRLGFNVIIADSEDKPLEMLINAAKTEGIDVYRAYLFSRPDGPEQQVITIEEKKALNAKLKALKAKTYSDLDGTEPVIKDDIVVKEMQCFDRSDTLAKMQDKLTRLSFHHPGLKGIAFDWIGYKNYYACFCENSTKAREEYAKNHPNLKPEEVLAAFSEESMVSFMNGLAAAVTKANPEWKSVCHLHPYFKPNPFFGAKLKINYVSYTASWFMSSNTEIAKVKAVAEKNVKDVKSTNKNVNGAPFIGIYSRSRPDAAKSADRITAELNAVKSAGAESVIVAELSELLADDSAAKAVSDGLGGSW